MTGAFLSFTGELETAVLTSKSALDASEAIDRVLAKAGTLGGADFEVLAGIASLASGSVQYWHEYELSQRPGDWGSRGMSVFLPPCGFWCRVGWADLVGSIAGAAGVIYTTPVGAALAPQAVLAGAAIGGIWSSVTRAI